MQDMSDYAVLEVLVAEISSDQGLNNEYGFGKGFFGKSS